MSMPLKRQSPVSARPRLRRGSAEDHEGQRQQIIEVAFTLYERAGVGALSMRALAADLGMSPMSLYRHFSSKADLLQALAEVVMTAAEVTTMRAIAGKTSARDRLRASIEAFIDYWEAHPAHFRLFYMTPQTQAPGPESPLTRAPAYQRNVGRTEKLIGDFIAEVGGDPKRALLARDLRLSLMLGYLHSRIVNTRYPWSDFGALRACAIETITLGVEACVRRAH